MSPWQTLLPGAAAASSAAAADDATAAADDATAQREREMAAMGIGLARGLRLRRAVASWEYVQREA